MLHLNFYISSALSAAEGPILSEVEGNLNLQTLDIQHPAGEGATP
jgi:hypothetical protein